MFSESLCRSRDFRGAEVSQSSAGLESRYFNGKRARTRNYFHFSAISQTMLAPEKKRAFRSLGLGIVLSVASLAYWYIHAKVADTRVQRLVTQCEKESLGRALPPRSDCSTLLVNVQAAASEGAFRTADRDTRVKLLVQIFDQNGYGRLSWDAKAKIAQHYLDTNEGRSPMPDREPKCDTPESAATSEDSTPACDLKDLKSDNFGTLDGTQEQIVNSAREAAGDRQDAWQYAVIVLSLSCLPFSWYFMLDKIRGN
jgi:hypothetical protein